MEEKVILVDKKGREIGQEEKIKTHEQGKLHRAFSVFVFNSKNQLLLQKRAKNKYHSNGLWTNTCCSHPRPGETIEEAAHRRLREEMGFDCELKEAFSFIYKTPFSNGLTENEYDHVFLGKSDSIPIPNPEEVDDWRWVSIEKLKQDLRKRPDNYSYWFKKIIERVIFCLEKRNEK